MPDTVIQVVLHRCYFFKVGGATFAIQLSPNSFGDPLIARPR
jgi:hypothetical protein